jgi:hypothetical protein
MPNETIVAWGTDGPIAVAAYDLPNKTTWFGIRSYDIRDGAGSFFTFQTKDSAGKWYDAVVLNGGFWKNAASGPSSCIDIIGLSKGDEVWVSLAGEGDGRQAGFGGGPDGVLTCGMIGSKWKMLYVKELPVPVKYANLPGHPTGCIDVNGKLAMLYDK